jgi:hypothetical protein
MSKFVAGLIAGLTVLIGAVALSATYYGFNPSTGQEGFHGYSIDYGYGTLPVLSGSCGTRSGQVGGASHGTFVAGAVTTCTTTVTFPTAAPNGYFCSFKDVTTPADTITTASFTTTSGTSSAATIVSGDTIYYSCEGF